MRYVALLPLLLLCACYVDPYTHAPAAAPTDWYQAGWNDAMSGHPIRSNLVIAHMHNDENVDREEWLKGYAEGQQRICDPQLLLLLGQSGKSFPASCETLPDVSKRRTQWEKGNHEEFQRSFLR
ncbi:DUF2799 domain-containing protein [Buttiauxella warmboldiae]|uniref:DUF2799 domain-containing protein n=1 Tax=Buttiauxella warmboldiae TaxID=82993 RepID=A0A3N5DRB1_9ENTR|nr:DUF2799 domain-containing protein [Buttiauxella warmboldiae]RPH24179.1 DUF2799 domain-containing protein [Buttiauxella warmboldiae]